MKVFILNLPSKTPIVRRYKCSYNAPLFLMPPLELSYLAGITKNIKGLQYCFKDYMSKKVEIDDVINDLKEFNPALIVTIVGIESIDHDMHLISLINDVIDVKVVIMGYLPSIEPAIFLRNSYIDFILKNEPEETYEALITCLLNNRGNDFSHIKGLAFKTGDQVKVNTERERIADIDKIPIPDRESILGDQYSEPYFGRPFTTMLYSRGCSFKCNFCVKTYGLKVVYHSVNRMIQELRHTVNVLNIKHIRFMDDNFTTNKSKVIALCDEIIKEDLKFDWICLSRVDTIDKEMVEKMKEAGCKRIYLGLESGNQNILDYYKKGYNRGRITETVGILKECKIEVFGFIMTGAPDETDEDFNKTLEFLARLNLDFAVLDLLMPYPGTELFEKMRGDIVFSVFPYRLGYKDETRWNIMKKRERLFFRSFYLSKSQIMKQLTLFFKYPNDSIKGYYTILKYFFYKKNKIHDKYV